MLILSTLIFVALTLAVAGLYLWLAPTRAEQRLQVISGPTEKSDWTATVVKIAGPLARLSTPEGEWDNSELRMRFFHAGIRNPNARLFYFGAKTLLPLVLAGLAYVVLRGLSQSSGLTLVFYLLLFAMIGCYLPNLLLYLKIRSRQRAIFENFPDAADLMLVCVEAGLGLDAGLTKVADEIQRKSVALAEELHLTNLEMRAGATREKSLRNLALRTGIEEIGTFGTMLIQADKFGTSIGDALRVFSDDLRNKRQVLAEEQAAKVPTKMLFPLVLCIFPSVIMIVLGPAIIRVIRIILPMLAGHA
ncbi:MAG: type II secretion system F family protein [Ramlibacter sp.]